MEGESFRIEIVGTPVHESTRSKLRANKTTSKDGVRGFGQSIYCRLIESFAAAEGANIAIDIKSRSMMALLEEISKTMLEKYKTSFPEFAEKDPFYFYMNGK